jgi:hypothetical protein
MKRIIRIIAYALAACLFLVIVAIAWVVVLLNGGPKPGTVVDEARRAGRESSSFVAAEEDYFHDMDGGVALTPGEVRGRNTWLVWTGGNDRFWDVLTRYAFGSFDLLKVLSSHPGLKYSRDDRWSYFGLVNEPCFEKPTGGDPDRFGLWFDKRRADCGPDPFEDESKYPGVAIGARGKTVPRGSYYGYASGVLGLRLFPNPDFDEAAAKKWDARRYYEDPTYYLARDLVRPYRVGMSCAFCHVGPSPVSPPADAENPKWENLSNTVGSQYFWIDRIFNWPADERNFIFQLLHTSRPGSLDPSLISTDYINNPRAMNAVYGLADRLAAAKSWNSKEILAGGALNNKQLNDYFKDGPLTQFFQAPDTVWTAHVLKDGADSAGALAALNRVYINIGLFSEEWLLHFNPLVGGKPITPILITDLRRNSPYWNATEAQAPDMAQFLVKVSTPHRLKTAPGGGAYLTESDAVRERGKEVFADQCARCHSSKAPTPPAGANPAACAGSGYLACWSRYWEWTETEAFREQMRQIVKAPDFLEQNYLSNDMRIPVTLLQTNACSPLATNAIAGNIWDNFSSQSYKDLPSVGEITYYDPYTGEPHQYQMPAGGVGYTRVPSLISIWSSAPFLLNNTVGPFDPSPSVDARMGVFNASIEQLLWPEKRARDPLLGDKVPGLIDRTTSTSYLRVPAGYWVADVPDWLRAALRRTMPNSFDGDDLRIGPIPAGTPIDLLSNLRILPEGEDFTAAAKHSAKLAGLLFDLANALRRLPADATDADASKAIRPLVPRFIELSKCPDFVVNRGHYFGTGQAGDSPGLSDADKRALIALLKTF